MTETTEPLNQSTARERDGPHIYEIRLCGHLDPQWAGWLGGLAVTHTAAGETLLRGELADQAALHGVLRQVRDLGLPLVNLRREPA